jgi:pimeloyl-ACP methyl ester carboxylesterase
MHDSPPAGSELPTGPHASCEECWLDIGGLRIHAVTAGPKDGELVLLLHGFPEFWFGWRHQIGPLAEAGYRVLAPDQRGYNLSDKPRPVRAYGLDRLAQDVVEMIRAAGHRRAILVGHDWGAVVAWWTAVRSPTHVRALGTINAPHPLVMRRHLRTNRAQRRRSRYILSFQLPWIPEWKLRRHDWDMCVRALVRTSRPDTFTTEDLAAYREAWNRPGAARGMLHWYRALLLRPSRRVPSARVLVPTMILWGCRDRFLGEEMVEPSLALCDRGQVERFPNGTHWVQHEEAEGVNRALLGFFRSLQVA